MPKPAPLANISPLIVTVRDQRVILDADLAALYGVSTMVLNQAVKRNQERFPKTFLFQLTRSEWLNDLKSQIVISNTRGGRRSPPYAFTEHGSLMAANVLNSPNAIQMSVALIAAFIRLREALAANHAMAKRLAEIESTVLTHDTALRDLYQKIRPLLLPPPDLPRRKIGFKTED
jgi:ORF6N domain